MIYVLLICIALVLFTIFIVLLCSNIWARNRLKSHKFLSENFQNSELSELSHRKQYSDLSSSLNKAGAPPLELNELVDIIWNSPITDLPLEMKCVEGFGITLLRRDLLKLKLGDWINDEIINFYMSLIVNRSQCLRCYPEVYAFNTFFYRSYIDKGFCGVRKWTKNVDLFNYDMLLVPVHRGAHWCLVVVDFVKEKMEFYDSTLIDGTPILKNIKKYLAEEHQEKKGTEMDLSRWFVESKKGIPTQKNGYDCGIFVCAFSERASRRAPINFSQNDMPRFRAQMTYEIYYSRLFVQS